MLMAPKPPAGKATKPWIFFEIQSKSIPSRSLRSNMRTVVRGALRTSGGGPTISVVAPHLLPGILEVAQISNDPFASKGFEVLHIKQSPAQTKHPASRFQ